MMCFRSSAPAFDLESPTRPLLTPSARATAKADGRRLDPRHTGRLSAEEMDGKHYPNIRGCSC